MGQRMLAVSVPGRDLRDAELAEQLARAEDWLSVDALRAPHDSSRAEATALVLMVDPERAMRLLS